MKLKEIIIWLGIFIVGSLIVSFILSPGSMEDIKDNVVSVFKYNSAIDKTIIKLIPSEMEEYGNYASWYKECTIVETLGNIGEIQNPKKVTCIEACGKRSMNYHSYDCDMNMFSCNCYKSK